MPRIALRVFALVAILGQLQQLPAAVACARHHKPTSDHCGVPVGAGGPGIQAENAGAPSPPCALLGTCAAPTPATLARAAAGLPAGSTFVVAPSALALLASISSPPVTPPPQA